MKATRKFKAQEQQQSAQNVAEEALEIAIKNVDLDTDTTKALRLTCKRTKVVTDAKVKGFKLTDDQEPKHVQRSGLLNNITKLRILFDLDNPQPIHTQKLSRSLGLLNLAVDVCGKFLENLEVDIRASHDVSLSFACIIGNSDWKVLRELTNKYYSMPGLLSGVFARDSLPVLRTLCSSDPSDADLEALSNSACIGDLTSLSLHWGASPAYNTAPTTVAGMRSLLQKATNVKKLELQSSTFEFFDSENLSSLSSLEFLHLGSPTEDDEIDVTPVLARRWTKLKTLEIHGAHFKPVDVLRIFEAEDTLVGLKKLTIGQSYFNGFVDTLLTRVCRPHLEQLDVAFCSNGHKLISRLAQVLKDDAHALPQLRSFSFNCDDEDSKASAREATSKLLACPQLATLETLAILNAQIGDKGPEVLYDIANHCPKLKKLDLYGNNLGRPAVALLCGYGMFMQALPELEELEGILDFEETCELERTDPNNVYAEHPYMQELDVEKTMQRVWPRLRCV